MTAVLAPALLNAGVARTARDLVEVETWRGRAATAGPADLFVELTIHTHERADGGLYPTVDHECVRRYRSLWLTAVVVLDGTATRPHQPDLVLLDLATPSLPAADWAALRLLWTDGPARSLSPGCSHQDPPAGADVAEALALTPDCPEDGYRFGDAFLVRELPRDVLDRARQVGAALMTSWSQP